MTKSPEKSGDAFRTIREVADWLGVPTHVLRFWESKFDQIAPVKGAGGRRYYRPEDMRLLGGIKVMLHDDGLTIRAVSQRIEEAGIESIMDLSPALEAGEPAPPQRTRRVIRKGDDQPARPGDEAGPKPEAPPPRDDVEAPTDQPSGGTERVRVPIAEEPATPLEETLPDQPNTDELPDGSPDPGESLIEAPAPTPSETPLDRSAPNEPGDAGDSAPTDPSEQIDHDPERWDDSLSDDPEVRPSPVAPTDPGQSPMSSDPLGRARALAQGARALSPSERQRLRRIVRRYRALVEEIAEDLAADTRI